MNTNVALGPVWPAWWLPVLLVLASLACLLMLGVLWLAWRARHGPQQAPAPTVGELAGALNPHLERLERELRDELGRLGQTGRSDLATFQQMLLNQGGDSARTHNEQLEAGRQQILALQQHTELALRSVSEQLNTHLLRLAETNERRLAEVRQTVDTRLHALQEGNEKKLDLMRATVDEKLHATLEQRLGESFRQVAERLEQVHKGLGEMHGLARDVGSLSRVLNNVKTRGVFGEMQLGGLLEQVFTPEQYAKDVATLPGSNERVDYAIRLPGRGAAGAQEQPLWLPIDAKFPREDYERLMDAHERTDPVAMEQAAKALETRLRLEAKQIHNKYVGPPHTTDFAVLFLPIEGLYAEALRRPGLMEALQREHKVMLAGPTTLLATLNSLQMGFRTLALEKRSAEVWEVLGAVKTEFGKFGEVLAKTRKKLEEASDTIDLAERRTRVMSKRLKGVEAMTEERTQVLLPPEPVTDDDG